MLMYIPTAYLNAFLHEDKLQVMRMPKYLADLIIKVDPKAKKYLQLDGSLLVEVLRALYGYPESATLGKLVTKNNKNQQNQQVH
jgi:hypothetical protein